MVALLSLNFGILFFDRNALNFLMPFVVPDLHYPIPPSASRLGPVVTWRFPAFFSARSDRSGRRKVISSAHLCLCDLFLHVGLATTFLVLLVSYLVVCWAFMPLFLTKMRGFSPTEMVG